MLRVCAADGCQTKTLGICCIDHERDGADDLNETLRSAIDRSADRAAPDPNAFDPRD